MRTERFCAWHVACRPAFHDKLTTLREGMSEESSVIRKGETSMWQKGGSYPEERGDAGAVRQSAGAMHTFELIGIGFSYIAGILASLREEVCRVALNAQATIIVAFEYACTTPIASLYDLPLSTTHTTNFPANNLIIRGVQVFIAHEPGSMLESKAGILSR